MSGSLGQQTTDAGPSSAIAAPADCRSPGFFLVIALLPLCWFGMMIVHEAGHVVGAWLTGGKVTSVVLHPLAISRTDVEPNPRPHFVVWAGPVVGVLVPIGIWRMFALFQRPETFLLRFFAGFCAVANGLYLGVGSFDRVGDAGDLLRSGAESWQLWLFGFLTSVVGFGLWNGQGRAFGFGPNADTVAWRHVSVVAGLLVAVLVLELTLN
ncbi:hypothetical protein GC176_13020 [bacterium]|nr:hypothetical protein [bacterium]